MSRARGFNKRTLLKDIGHQSLKTQMRFIAACNAQSVPPMDGNVPRTGPQQEDLVKTRTYFTVVARAYLWPLGLSSLLV